MKAQSEIVTFVLLFAIGLLIFVASVVWGRGVTEQNLDTAKIATAENFMKSFNDKIESVIRSGGSYTIGYPLDMEVRFIDSGISDVIELRKDVTTKVVPAEPIDITPPGSLGVIKEQMEGPTFKIQLAYPLQDSFAVDFFTDGTTAATPRSIRIEKNSTYNMEIGGKTYEVVKIKLTLQ